MAVSRSGTAGWRSALLRAKYVLTILKLDPSPALVSSKVLVTFSLTNQTSASAHFRVTGRTDEGATLPQSELDVGAGAEIISSVNVSWQHPGQHSVTLEAKPRTGDKILHQDPGGFHWEDQYGESFGDTDSLSVLASLDAVPHPTVADIGPDEPNGSHRRVPARLA